MDRVYVANLPPDIRIKDIDDFFQPFGKLVYIDVNHRANPVYANVQFDSPRNAFNAVRARHGYDYEGYTLQLRLVENEVRKRRDVTPPPPPPSMFKNYDRQNINGGFSNNYNSNRMAQNYSANSSNSQWSNNNRGDMQQFPINNRLNIQQNMDFPSNNRSNMQQSNMMSYSSANCPNMGQQFSNMPYSNISRSNMSQQYSNFNTNTQQQYSNINRSNIPRLNTFESRPDMSPYLPSDLFNMQQQLSNTRRSNIPKLQNMNIQCPDNSSWDTRNNNMGWNTGNFGNGMSGNNFNNNYDNTGANESYNRDNCNDQSLEDRFTAGLSGAGRKWFNRYISKGFSPEMARTKALEHRKLPYLRGDAKPIPNDPTNMALETIGNTIINLLSDNPIGNTQPGFSNNMGGINNEMAGPSSSVAPQAKGNAVSKRQYFKSMGALKAIRDKPVKSSKDEVSLKYHTQIVKDYRKFNQIDSISKNGIARTTISTSTTSRIGTLKKPRISTRTEKEISELLIKQKAKLLKKARELVDETRNKKRLGGAYKKRTKILMDNGFLELEAKSLAWNPLNTLEELLNLKREYDLLAKKTVFIPQSKASLAKAPKIVVYRNDLRYLEEYSKHRIKGLSKTILYGLDKCLKRIHDYERSEHLPLTENNFTKLLLKITSRPSFFKNIKKTGKKTGSAEKKDAKENKKPESEQEVKANDPNNGKDIQAQEENQVDAEAEGNEEDVENGGNDDAGTEDQDTKT